MSYKRSRKKYNSLTRLERERRRRQQKRQKFIGISVCVVLVALVVCAVIYGNKSLSVRNEQYKAQIEELNKQIEQQQAKSDELEEYRKYVQTKKFVEQIAKDKFGMLYPNEILLKPDNKK